MCAGIGEIDTERTSLRMSSKSSCSRFVNCRTDIEASSCESRDTRVGVIEQLLHELVCLGDGRRLSRRRRLDLHLDALGLEQQAELLGRLQLPRRDAQVHQRLVLARPLLPLQAPERRSVAHELGLNKHAHGLVNDPELLLRKAVEHPLKNINRQIDVV